MKHFRLTLLLVITLPIAAQTQKLSTASPESRAAHAFRSAKKAGASELYAFLKDFPKGGDLHMHLSGAIYAETFLAEAAQENLCIDPEALAIVAAPCKKPAIPAAEAIANQKLYDKLIDAFSMRSFVPYAGWSGHDQFFDTFGRWDSLEKSAAGEWLDEVATRAAAQNEQYLEIMQTPSFNNAIAAATKLGWPKGEEKSITPAQLAALRTALLSIGLRNDIAIDKKEFSTAKDSFERTAHCSPAPDFIDPKEEKACKVKIHFLYQVLRGFPPQQVFAQTLLGFEVAEADPDVVGINFVMPEDGRISMEDYHLQMQMVDYLHSVYPKVHISLHAGELAPGLVPPAGLSFHIREAIDLGHAQRIGHGIDVLYEDRAGELLKQMAANHIDVEINLTSNEGILGVKGKDHPLHAYMAAHVPFSLSTDDEGVSRIDLTHEYVKAVEEQHLTYADLKYSARNSLEYSFLHGASLYPHPGDYAHRVSACAGPIKTNPSGTCAAFLSANEKAEQQYDLERRFAAFEISAH